MCTQAWPDTVRLNLIWLWWSGKPETLCGYMEFWGKGLISYQSHGDLFGTWDLADLTPGAVLVAQSWGHKGSQRPQVENLACGSKKQLNLPPASPMPSDQRGFWKSMQTDFGKTFG